MEDTRELFHKIKRNDKESFHLLTENYGWKLYSYIRRNVEDREAADRIFSEALSRFHDAMARQQDCEDPIEAMLYVCADQVNLDETAETPDPLSQMQLSGAEKAAPEQKKPAKKGGFRRAIANFFFGLCVLVLIIAILAALWFLVGTLVELEVLPASWDLGYSWFNANVAEWF